MLKSEKLSEYLQKKWKDAESNDQAILPIINSINSNNFFIDF